jgi:hypothetical protein
VRFRLRSLPAHAGAAARRQDRRRR